MALSSFIWTAFLSSPPSIRKPNSALWIWPVVMSSSPMSLKINSPRRRFTIVTVALQKIERDFRTLKTGMLEVRPVFVRKDSRTRGHVFCCMLALKLYRELERRLASVFATTDKDPHAVTVSDALAALNRLCLLVYDLHVTNKSGKKDETNQKQKKDQTTVTRLPKPDPQQRRILEALRVPFPEKL